MLTRESILAADDLPRERVNIPEWGGEVYVRSLTGAERDTYERSWFTGEGENRKLNLANLRARFAVLVVCDEAGKRMFTDADTKTLGEKSAAALDRIYEVGQRLNKMEPGAVEEISKNSGETDGSESTTN